MNYVLLYVYVLIAETVNVDNKKRCFINCRFNIKNKYNIGLRDSKKDQVELLESPSKQINNAQFFNLTKSGVENNNNIKEEDNYKWASFEVRRFTYKLGRYNKKLRKVKESKRSIYSNFNVDDNELKKLNLKSRDITKAIENFKKYRNIFIKYLRGLNGKNKPVVPYVPPELRSEKIPIKYYNQSQEPKNKDRNRYKHKLDKNKSKKDQIKKQCVDRDEYINDEDKDSSELMSILAEVKGKRYYKGKIY